MHEININKHGLLCVISSPSGGGKTSVIKSVLHNNPKYKYSISATTRKKRPRETHGIDYYFIASRQPRLTMNPLDERVSVFDTYSTLKDMTTGAISIPFGTNHMVIKAPKVQLLNYSKGDREGLVSNEITFKLLKNGTTDATIESEATFQLLQGATA